MPYKRTKQYRLPGYDYSQNGAYFITIVTKNREHHFGRIIGEYILLSRIGNVARGELIYLDHKEHLSIPEWEILPDHIHLILVIDGNSQDHYQVAQGLQPLVRDSVSAVVNHFKGRVKRWCNQNGYPDFEWQARFHDRIIRDEREYNRIAQYIRSNIDRWEKDHEG